MKTFRNELTLLTKLIDVFLDIPFNPTNVLQQHSVM